MTKGIRQEKPSYLTLLFRKSTKVKIIETMVFIVLLLILVIVLGYSHPLFKIGAVLTAVITLGVSPIIYKIVVKPVYTLTEQDLIIQKANKATKVPIKQIKPASDLRFFYMINGKKMSLTVSDAFLDALNTQIEIIQKIKHP